jgi:hypothetical protein
MTATTARTEPVHYGVVTGPYEEDRQVYADYGDGSYLSTHAEQMATSEFFRLSALGVRCGIWRAGELLAGENLIFVDVPEEPAEEEAAGVEHKTRTFCPKPETGLFDKRGRPIRDRSACGICTCGWVQWESNRELARKVARAHREEMAAA